MAKRIEVFGWKVLLCDMIWRLQVLSQLEVNNKEYLNSLRVLSGYG